MRRRSSLTRIGTFVIAFALAFAQVAMASFVPSAGMPAMQQGMASEDGCQGGDPGGKHLCMKTCQAEAQKSEIPVLAALPPPVEMGLRITFPELANPEGCAIGVSLLARLTAPPLHLLFSRFLK
jgi:hypothetical protein